MKVCIILYYWILNMAAENNQTNNHIELTDEELNHILVMRQKRQDQEQSKKLYAIAAKLFAKWAEYNAVEGMGLTFSVFLDDFRAETHLDGDLPAGVSIRQIYDLMAALDEQLNKLCRSLFRTI